MLTTVAFIILALVVIALALLGLMYQKVSRHSSAALESCLEAFEKAQERTERVVKEEIALSRGELGKAASDQRQELSSAFKTFGDAVGQRISDVASLQKAQLEAFAAQLTVFANTISEKLDGARAESATAATQLRQEVVRTLTEISDAMARTLKELAAAEKLQLEAFSKQIESLTKTSGEKLEAVRTTVEAQLQSMKSDNATQLEQMRLTVDEKLQGTLEKRLGESFKQVSERLEQVHKGLGEMQSLATGVGDLKKVLTNVTIRGSWGEKQLEALLEQVLSPDQFAKNVSTKGNSEHVEFAVKLPGHGEDKNEVVWLPIDSKFPREDYERLIDAQQRADKEEIDAAGKALEKTVLSCAQTISEKYLAPPNTTDFGILFLPVEGLFAETIRRTVLIDCIQQKYRVIVAGPTTLWSILNSLQMGFRTLAIEKRTSEVWNLLAGVKTEWTKYGEVLDAVEKKLHQATDTIEKAKVRSRAIGRKLKDVQELPANEARALLPHTLLTEEAEPSEHDVLEEEEVVE
jgi:DNA recombination protein RmuC